MKTHVKAMDFFRSIAILLVLLAHSVLNYGAPSYLAPLQFGGTGVDLFFLLSGWLLGSQIFKEVEQTGALQIKRFWIRRWLRTLPAYYFVLMLTLAHQYLTKTGFDSPWLYFLFLQNYTPPLSYFTVSWSLCVEEQFYLAVAPFIALLLRVTPSARLLILCLLLFLPSAFRFLGWYSSLESTHVRLDCCIAGVILACIRHEQPSVWRHLVRYAPPVAVAGLLLYLLAFYGRWDPRFPIRDLSSLLLAAIFGSWVVVANGSARLSGLVYLPGSTYIATRAYALYLLHPEALAIMRRFGQDLPFPLYLLLSFLLSVAIAEPLYRLIEKPVMDLRERLDISRTPHEKS